MVIYLGSIAQMSTVMGMGIWRTFAVGLVQQNAERITGHAHTFQVTSGKILILTFSILLITFVPMVATLRNCLRHAKITNMWIVLTCNVLVPEILIQNGVLTRLARSLAAYVLRSNSLWMHNI